MVSQKLADAREYERKAETEIPEELRPLFHLTPRSGWMNDPNGFSEFDGMYHLFYQYYPYDTKWGPMHWGHAVSRDLLHWQYLPCALAPDGPFDPNGCFSGSAECLPDGRQFLIYTGIGTEDAEGKCPQTQNIAVRQGDDFIKYEGNPVLTANDLPNGSSPYDFRDPKVFKKADGTYGCVAVSMDAEGCGRVLYYTSPDGLHWSFDRILIENDGTYGHMWECPDYFELDGKSVLLVSPMEMIRAGTLYSGNSTVCMIGTEAKDGTFSAETEHPIDCGIDFYATQTLLSEDGRRIMVAWMQNWDTITDIGDGMKWNGSMTLPRELHVKNNILVQTPIRELEQLRGSETVYENRTVREKTEFPGIRGRVYDLNVTIRPEERCSFAEIRMAEDEKFHTSLIYRPLEGTLTFDRTFSGSRRAIAHTRSVPVTPGAEGLKLRIILDRFSCEVFIGEGETVMTHRVVTDLSADRISFNAIGSARFDIRGCSLAG